MRQLPSARIRSTALVIALLLTAPQVVAAPVFRTSDAPPPGFEAFFQRQRTEVDVYYAGHFLVSTDASYDVDSISFDDPEAIVSAVPDLLEPARITEALSGDLDSHAGALCGRTPSGGCGQIRPEVAGVIFDSSRFRATLFIAPDQLATRGPDIRKFLPPSDSDFSVLQNLSASLSGSSRDTGNAYNVTSLSSMSFGETNLQLESSYGSRDDLTVDQAFARHEFEGRALQGGLYRSRGQSLGFVRERDLVGVRAESSLDTRADRAFAGGTPIEVFLPTRSRVEIRQDGRLLDTRAYDAGNQVLDTSDLPDGAYDIDLRIIDASGTARSERRFFVKTTRLPPRDQPLWHLEAGRIVDRNTGATLPRDTGDWFARAGTTRRIGAGLGVDVGLAAGRGDGLAEAGVFRVGRLGEVQASAFAGTGGAHGVAMLARLQWNILRASTDYRHLSGTGTDGLTGPDLEQVNATLSAPLFGGALSASSRYEARSGSSRTAQSLSWNRTLLRTSRGGLRLTMDLSREDQAWVGLMSLQFDYREGQVSGSVQPSLRMDRFRDRSSDVSGQTDARLAWERQRDNGDLLRLGVNGTSGRREDRIGAETQYEGRLGAMRADVDHDLGRAGETSWTGTFNTSVLSDGNSVSVGGRDSARSAALVEIDGDVPDASFEVLVDGYARGLAPAGSVTPIHLRPWQTYHIRLRPVGSALIAWENREEQITLYPGNVVRLRWQVKQIVILLGRIRDPAGEPVANARIDGASGFAMTEDGGLFQAEVERPPDGAGTVRLELRRRHAAPCTVTVDTAGLKARKGVIKVGTLTCMPAS